jgi:hypothetical protein
MNPGDTRTFKHGEGNAVVLAVGLWAERRNGDGPIHIHITGTDRIHTTVTNNQNSERFHRTLFRDLRRVLIEHKCWQYGEAGSETETKT